MYNFNNHRHKEDFIKGTILMPKVKFKNLSEFYIETVYRKVVDNN